MNTAESFVRRTRVLVLKLDGAEDLSLLLNSVVEPGGTFEMGICGTFSRALQPAEMESRLFRAVQDFRPDIVAFCLPTEWAWFTPVLASSAKHLRGARSLFVLQTSNPESWCELLEFGPDDFITAPFTEADVVPRLWRLHPRGSDHDPVVQQLKETLGLRQLVGESPALLSEIKKIPAVARCDATVLISGETGTGKEMVARAIHHLSPRARRPFMPVNCGAIPVELVENELFGHESGAFTSAQSASAGLVRKTEGGTLFLDEVDCLPLLAQVKLLRFLQEREFRPLGANKASHVDVRAIAASNVNLEEAARSGRFRQDLYFRLNVITLTLPPLRERRGDIPLLAQHFLAKYAAHASASRRELTTSARQKLMLHDWPGNVRELENVIQRSLILSSKTTLGVEDIELPHDVTLEEGERFQSMKAKVVAEFERAYIRSLLREHQGNISRAATVAGKNRRAFWELMRKHHIKVDPRTRAEL